MEELILEVYQKFCFKHLYNNFKKRFFAKLLKKMTWRTAKITYLQAWEREMKEIGKVNEEGSQGNISSSMGNRSFMFVFV